MKRLLFLLLLINHFIGMYSSGHIKFMGLNMTGCIEQYKDSLNLKGFTFISSDSNSFYFYGVFANEPVKLCVVVSPVTKTVCKTIVFFKKKDSWNALKSDYFEKKHLYTNKYPMDRDYEFFASPYEDGDGYELRALSRDKCHYISFFYAMGGYISIEIEKNFQVSVTYEDRENMDLAKRELENLALDDI